MPKPLSAAALLATLGLLGACETAEPVVYRYPEPPKGSKEAEIEMLQKDAVLATGNQAWEAVQISNIQHDAKGIKWIATTRSRYMICGADKDGSNPYCDYGAAPTTPQPVTPAQ